MAPLIGTAVNRRTESRRCRVDVSFGSIALATCPVGLRPSILEVGRDVDFWGRWMPDAVFSVLADFLGEPAVGAGRARGLSKKQYYGDNGWTQPDHSAR